MTNSSVGRSHFHASEFGTRLSTLRVSTAIALVLLSPAFVSDRQPRADGPDGETRVADPDTPHQSALRLQIADAWRARQDHVRWASFKWRETRAFPKGSIMPPTAETLPAQDTTVVIDGISLSLGPDKIRFETEMKTSRLPHRGGAILKYTVAYDGDTATSYYIPAGESVGNGDIQTSAEFPERTSINTRALLLALRPFSRQFLDLSLDSYDIETIGEGLNASTSTWIIRDRPEARADARVQSVVWADPARDFVPVRFCEFFQGSATVQLDIFYEANADHGWLPKQWTHMFLNLDKSPKYVVDGTVVAFSINEPVPDASFRIDFPLGTHIADRNSGEEYVLDEFGKKHPLTNWGEAPESPEEQGAFRAKSRSHTTWAFIGIISVAAIVPLLAWLRKARLGRG